MAEVNWPIEARDIAWQFILLKRCESDEQFNPAIVEFPASETSSIDCLAWAVNTSSAENSGEYVCFLEDG